MGEPIGADRTSYDAETPRDPDLKVVLSTLLERLSARDDLASGPLLPFVPRARIPA